MRLTATADKESMHREAILFYGSQQEAHACIPSGRVDAEWMYITVPADHESEHDGGSPSHTPSLSNGQASAPQSSPDMNWG